MKTLKEINTVNATINDLIIAGIDPAKVQVIKDSLLKVNVPVRQGKKDKPAHVPSTVFNNYYVFAEKTGFDAVNPTPENFGLWLEKGRKAGKKSHDITVNIGRLLQGENLHDDTWHLEKGDYNVNAAPYWTFCELWRVGLAMAGYKPTAGYPSKKDFAAWLAGKELFSAWAIFQ
jgi:hypothetical protein